MNTLLNLLFELCKSLRFPYHIYKLFNKDVERLVVKDNDIKSFADEADKLNTRLNNELSNRSRPLLLGNKYDYLCQLRVKLNRFINQYLNLKQIMEKNGISYNEMNIFCRNKKNNSTFHRKCRNEGVSSSELAKDVDEIIADVKDRRNK